MIKYIRIIIVAKIELFALGY